MQEPAEACIACLCTRFPSWQGCQHPVITPIANFIIYGQTYASTLKMVMIEIRVDLVVFGIDITRL